MRIDSGMLVSMAMMIIMFFFLPSDQIYSMRHAHYFHARVYSADFIHPAEFKPQMAHTHIKVRTIKLT